MLGTLLFQEVLMAEVRSGVHCYRMLERKDTLSLATLAFLLKRHHVREGRQGREVRRELMVWPLPRKAAEEFVGIASSLLAWPGLGQCSHPPYYKV